MTNSRSEKRVNLTCFLDGDCLCVIDKAFKNIVESEAVFIKLTEEQKEKIGGMK